MLLATLAGLSIPLGAALARYTGLFPEWVEQEYRHTIIAFGGGALLGAVALVLVPEGMKHLSIFWVAVCFAGGGITFAIIDRLLMRMGGSASLLMAMLLDFVPEAAALGAMLTTTESAALLLAILIALQNLPEGFGAFRELRAAGEYTTPVLLVIFSALVLLGPAAAWAGVTYLSTSPVILGALMLFSAGGILYLTFGDIAPEAKMSRAWAPPLGAVGGFLLGMIGHMMIA